jgi:hypothetical protein
MLKLSFLAAIAVVGSAALGSVAAQTPGAAPAEKSPAAPALHADSVPPKPTRFSPPASFSKSARLQHKQAATAGAAMRRHGSARTQTNATVASVRHATAHSQANGPRLASLKPGRAHAVGKAGATAHSKIHPNLRSNRTARSAASAFAFLPARAEPQLRARTAAARRKTMHNLPTSALLPKKSSSRGKSG